MEILSREDTLLGRLMDFLTWICRCSYSYSVGEKFTSVENCALSIAQPSALSDCDSMGAILQPGKFSIPDKMQILSIQ